MIDIAICDDDCLFAGGLETSLCDLQEKYGLNLEIDRFQNGSDLLKAIAEGSVYDIIFMDIQMGEISGLETARCIRDQNRTVELIYVTSYDGYMKDAFEAAPSGFIVKPLKSQELEATFLRVLRTVLQKDSYYRFRYKKEEYKVLVRDILYFYSDLRKTNIVWEGGIYTQYMKLNEIDEAISQEHMEFLRIHKSYLVNYRHVVKFSYDKVLMSDGKILPMSDYRRKETDEKLKKLIALSMK